MIEWIGMLCGKCREYMVLGVYNESRACVREESGMSEWFDVNVDLSQGCVMSSWLFNMYRDGVVREVNERVLGRGVE